MRFLGGQAVMCCTQESQQQPRELIGTQGQHAQHQVAHHLGVSTHLHMAGTELILEAGTPNVRLLVAPP